MESDHRYDHLRTRFDDNGNEVVLFAFRKRFDDFDGLSERMMRKGFRNYTHHRVEKEVKRSFGRM